LTSSAKTTEVKETKAKEIVKERENLMATAEEGEKERAGE